MGKSTFLLILFLMTAGIAGAQQPGEGRYPVPIFTSATVNSGVSFDPASGLYTYAYTITNPSSNTGEIRFVAVDITRPKDSLILPSNGLVIPMGVVTKTFDEVYLDFSKPIDIVPVGMSLPAGSAWTSSVAKSAIFFTDSPNILPGQTVSGLQIHSPGLPSIRVVKLKPDWVYAGIVDNETIALSNKISESLVLRLKTLGPASPPAVSGEPNLSLMLGQLSGYVDEAVTLGWLKDAALHDALKAKVETAKTDYASASADNTASARAALNEFIALVSQSFPAQRTDEGYALFYFNAKYILDHLPEWNVGQESLSLLPEQTSSTMGAWVTLNARYLVNELPVPSIGSYGPPLIRLHVISGPNTDVYLPNIDGYLSSADDVQFGHWNEAGRLADANGNASFRYYSMQEGTDTVVAEQVLEGFPYLVSQPVEVKWKGGPDLVVGFFFPPVIEVMPGETALVVQDTTRNQGDGPAGPSVTRYYLSVDRDISTAQDYYLGERTVQALAPGQQDKGGNITVNLPAGLKQDTLYYIGACVDADQTVPELDENNNCSTNGATQITMPMKKIKNKPPVCTAAVAFPDTLWPPNHKMASISITGVTDPDNDPVTLTITAIQQDEPVNGLGDGDTSPDASGVGTASAQLRAERSGTGNGRVYGVSFKASDGKGGECTGMVAVGVPHDRIGPAAFNDGLNYDSTMP